jgi:hypothetical protein
MQNQLFVLMIVHDFEMIEGTLLLPVESEAATVSEVC